MRRENSIVGNMLSSWPIKRLGEVIELQYGKGIARHERDDTGEFPIYGANGVLGWTNKAWISGEAIIVGRKGSAGELTRVSGRFWPSDVTYYVFGNNYININYLFYFLTSVNLPRFSVGVKPGINRNCVYEIDIPLPPIEEQKRIVAKLENILGKVKEAKRLRAEAQAATDNLLPAALHKIFDEEKNREKIKNLTSLTNGRGFKTSEWVSGALGALPIIRIQNLNNQTKGFNYFSGDFDEKILVNHGDLLFSWSGSRGTSFGPHIWTGPTGLLNQHIFKVIYNKERVHRNYFYFAMKHLVDEVEGNLHGGVGLVHITKTKFENLSINLPPLAEQKKIVAHLDSLSEKIRQLQDYQKQTAADLDALEKSILHQAFEGKL